MGDHCRPSQSFDSLDKRVISDPCQFFAVAPVAGVVYPWMRLAMEKGVKARLARNVDGFASKHELESLVDDQTSVISISHVEYGTGQKFDLKWLSELAHSHGSLLVVDVTQSAGLVPIGMRQDGVDVLVAGGYKGLLGPFGVSTLYVRRELMENLKSLNKAYEVLSHPQARMQYDQTKIRMGRGN